MKPWIRTSVIKHAVFSMLSVAAGIALGGVARAAYVPGEVIVKYRDHNKAVTSAMAETLLKAGVARTVSLGEDSEFLRQFGQLTLRDGVDVKAAIAKLSASPMIEYVQPNYILRAFPNTAPMTAQDDPPFEGIPCIPGFPIPGCDPNGNPGAPVPCLFPGIPFPPGCEDSSGPVNPPATRPPLQARPSLPSPAQPDPALSRAYGLGKIQAPQAWNIFGGSEDIIVADIDTGIDYNHEDLAYNVWRNPNPGPKSDVVGFDFVHNDGLPYDDQGHGTHTAGTIGAVGGNGKGVSGVAPRVSIMSVKFLSSRGEGSTADAIRSIDYAIEHGAKVLSNSWGGQSDGDNQALLDAILRAQAKDVLFVVAAGNESQNNDNGNPKASYPAAFATDNMIGVAATDSSDRMAFFSNFGVKTTHLAAPGVDIYSTTPANNYKTESGTSMACPHVAGAAALLWAKHPGWTYRQVKEALLNSVDTIPSLSGKVSTGGRLNILKALQL